MMVTEIAKKDNPSENKTLSAEDIAAYRQWRADVAQLLQDGEHFDEAELWDYCNDSPRYKINRGDPTIPEDIKTAWVCSTSCDHQAVLFSPTCDNRVCPDCAQRATARLLARYVPAIAKLMEEYPKHRLRTIVFTRVITLGDDGFKEIAQEGFKLIQKVMRKVVGEKWNKDGAGMLVNWEVGSNGLKLHYHAVYFGDWVEQRKLSTEWKKATGDSYVVWVSGIKHNKGDWEKKVKYTLKYATKFYSRDSETGKRKYLSPELTIELFKALKGTRRIRSYGSLYSIGEPPERMFCCDDCGSPMIRIGKSHWNVWVETGFSPDEWSEMSRGSLLHLSIANKSPPLGAKGGQLSTPSNQMLPLFDKVAVKGMVHYEYE